MYYYEIDEQRLRDATIEIVARVADGAYGEDGTSLYDTIIITERDYPVVNGFINDAVLALVHRASDICDYLPSATAISFDIPDFDEALWEETLSEAIYSYVRLYAANSIFISRRPAAVPEYTERVQSAMDKVIALARKRKKPTRV